MDIIGKQGTFLVLQDSLDGLFLACCASLDAQGITMWSCPVYFKLSTIVETLCRIIDS